VPLERLRMEINQEIKAAQLVSKIRSLGQHYQAMAADPESKHAQDAERWERWVRRYQTRLQAEGGAGEGRVQRMKASNPAFILRNWIAFKATEAAESGDFSKVNTVLEMLQQPYRAEYSIFTSPAAAPRDPRAEEFIRPPPDWAPSFTCTCSS
jgi:serine/tyrosine/threonine adenylyltransferase